MVYLDADTLMDNIGEINSQKVCQKNRGAWAMSRWWRKTAVPSGDGSAETGSGGYLNELVRKSFAPAGNIIGRNGIQGSLSESANFFRETGAGGEDSSPGIR